jgi:hypothetical protein
LVNFLGIKAHGDWEYGGKYIDDARVWLVYRPGSDWQHNPDG